MKFLPAALLLLAAEAQPGARIELSHCSDDIPQSALDSMYIKSFECFNKEADRKEEDRKEEDRKEEVCKEVDNEVVCTEVTRKPALRLLAKRASHGNPFSGPSCRAICSGKPNPSGPISDLLKRDGRSIWIDCGIDDLSIDQLCVPKWYGTS